MPYIKPEDRVSIDDLFKGFPIADLSVGELNYLITHVIDEWCPLTPRYSDYSAIIGVLECAKQEFYLRVVVPYEGKKRKENGDVFKST